MPCPAPQDIARSLSHTALVPLDCGRLLPLQESLPLHALFSLEHIGVDVEIAAAASLTSLESELDSFARLQRLKCIAREARKGHCIAATVLIADFRVQALTMTARCC